jgi:hypothetical protein
VNTSLGPLSHKGWAPPAAKHAATTKAKHSGTSKHKPSVKQKAAAKKWAAAGAAAEKAKKAKAKVTAKAKPATHAKATTLALTPWDVGCCGAEALAASLRLDGVSVTDEDMLGLFWRAGGHPDKGVPILTLLEAASESGLAGFRPSFEPADLGEVNDGGRSLILAAELPGPHAVVATDEGWWSWGGLWCPCEFPDAVVESAWAVTWDLPECRPAAYDGVASPTLAGWLHCGGVKTTDAAAATLALPPSRGRLHCGKDGLDVYAALDRVIPPPATGAGSIRAVPA